MLAGTYRRGIVTARVSVFVRPNSFVNSTVTVADPARAPGRMATSNVRRWRSSSGSCALGHASHVGAVDPGAGDDAGAGAAGRHGHENRPEPGRGGWHEDGCHAAAVAASRIKRCIVLPGSAARTASVCPLSTGRATKSFPVRDSSPGAWFRGRRTPAGARAGGRAGARQRPARLEAGAVREPARVAREAPVPRPARAVRDVVELAVAVRRTRCSATRRETRGSS